MTLEEATNLQTQLLCLLPEVGFNKYLASTKLGIEALREVDRLRETGSEHPYSYLLGETGYKNET